MIKMTTELFDKFSTKQEELDSMIREKFGISEEEWEGKLNYPHGIALKVEVAEFVNECHDLWKYWKQKAVTPNQILDEAVDVIHFMHLITNKNDEVNATEYVELINHSIEEYDRAFKDGEFNIDLALSTLLTTTDFWQTYSLLFLILDHYSFTLDDIEQAYDRKNAENHARQARNY